MLPYPTETSHFPSNALCHLMGIKENVFENNVMPGRSVINQSISCNDPLQTAMTDLGADCRGKQDATSPSPFRATPGYDMNTSRRADSRGFSPNAAESRPLWKETNR
jgi:hypothetical protein